MLKRHAIQVLRQAGHTLEEIGELVDVGKRSVQRVVGEPVITHHDTEQERARRAIGRPSKAEAYRTRSRAGSRRRPSCGAWNCSTAPSSRATMARRARSTSWCARSASSRRGRSCASRACRASFRSTTSARWTCAFWTARRKRVHFFASRLKYSRWVEVTIVPNEQVETLVRALVDHFAAIGGIPLLAVFDRPKTVALKWRKNGEVTEWNPVFAGVALDLGLGIEVCWPSRPSGAERLRRESGRLGQRLVSSSSGASSTTPISWTQLAEWLAEVNTQRPSRATGVIPAVRLEEERPRLRPLKVAPADLALRIPIVVSADGLGHPRHASATRCRPMRSAFPARCSSIATACASSPAASRRRASAALFEPYAKSTLPEHRAQLVAAVSGKRAKRYLQREHLLELGPAALEYLTELTHRRPRVWLRDVDRLHGLLADARRRRAARGLRARSHAGDWRRVHRALPGGRRDRSTPSGHRGQGQVPPRATLERVRMTATSLARHGHPLPRPAADARHRSRSALQAPAPRQRAARVARSRACAPSRRRGPIAISSRCSSPKRSRIASRRGSRGSRAAPRFPFSRRSMISISRISRRCGSRSSAPPSRPDFVTEGRSLILTGKPGRGKTHLAVAIAYRAIQNGFDARFVTAAELIDDLSAAFRAGRLAEALTTYTHPGRPRRRRSRLSHLRHRRRQHALPRRQRSPSPKARDDLHHEQTAHRLGPRPARRGPRPGDRRSRPRARPPPHARRALTPHQAPRP